MLKASESKLGPITQMHKRPVRASIRYSVDRSNLEAEKLSADHDYVARFKLDLGFYFDKGAVSAPFVGQYEIAAALNNSGMLA
jgi:hypothetical protein